MLSVLTPGNEITSLLKKFKGIKVRTTVNLKSMIIFVVKNGSYNHPAIVFGPCCFIQMVCKFFTLSHLTSSIFFSEKVSTHSFSDHLCGFEYFPEHLSDISSFTA